MTSRPVRTSRSDQPVRRAPRGQQVDPDPGSGASRVAGGMLAVGVVLWALTWFANRGLRGQKTGFRDIERLE